MSKDAASNGNGDLRDRSLAAAISVALHIAAVAWIWFVGDQADSGKSEAHGHSGDDGMSASFIAADEFRQRIETKPPLPSSEVTATSEETQKGAPSEPAEPTVDLPDSAESGDPATYPASDATAAEENETAPTKPMETALTQGGGNAGGNKDVSLRGAYLAALRAAIRRHWNYQGPPQQCSLTIKQSPGGAVQSAIAGNCSLAPQDRRSLEAAALMAQPLPYAGFETAFTSETQLDANSF